MKKKFILAVLIVAVLAIAALLVDRYWKPATDPAPTEGTVEVVEETPAPELPVEEVTENAEEK